MIPGEMFIKEGEIELNAGRRTLTLTVANTGDRPIQVGSHYHFFETNPALKFERKKARGMRLDIAAGTAVRFEPGQTRDVTLVALAGKRTVYGFRQDVMGKLVGWAPNRCFGALWLVQIIAAFVLAKGSAIAKRRLAADRHCGRDRFGISPVFLVPRTRCREALVRYRCHVNRSPVRDLCA